MYYVNHAQIEVRLQFIQVIADGLVELVDRWQDGDVLLDMAQERLLSLAIETVTDVGSYLIDGFMMRDASSYSDIITVLQGESVIAPEAADLLCRLVDWRKPLMQHYYEMERGRQHPLVAKLPDTLLEFARCTRRFIDENMI